MALGVGATEKAPCEKLPPPIPLSHQRMWLRCATGGSGNSPSHWWCRSCDGDHSALGGLLLWSQRTAGGEGAYHVSILQELGAAELAALFFLGLQSLKGGEEVLTIHHLLYLFRRRVVQRKSFVHNMHVKKFNRGIANHFQPAMWNVTMVDATCPGSQCDFLAV